MSRIVRLKTGSNNYLEAEELASLANEFFPSGNAVVTSAEIKPFSGDKLGFLGSHELLSIEAHEEDGDPRKTKRSVTFFVKSLILTPNTFDKFVFKEESKFYREVMPKLTQICESEPWAAKCSLVKDSLFVLEDLKSQGFQVTSATPLSYEELTSAVECLARFHASSMLLEEKLGKPLDKVYPESFVQKVYVKDKTLFWKWLVTGIEVIEAIAETIDLDPKYASMAYETVLDKVKPAAGDRNVICHYDLWCNNVMFKKSDGKVSCRLVDFQLITYTSYAIDVVQLVYLNTVSDRRYLDECLQVYHKTLEAHLRKHGSEKVVSLEEIKRDVEDKRICGIVAAAQYFPISLLDKDMALKYASDTKTFELHTYTSRRDFVLDALKRERAYRDKVRDAVRELIEYVRSCEKKEL